MTYALYIDILDNNAVQYWKGGDNMDDELEIELDDIDLGELSLTPDIPGKVAPSLPLVTPTTPTSMPTTMDYRKELIMVADAKKLFDFSRTKLTPIQQMYIIAFATRGTKRGACELAGGIPYNTVSKWMENNEFVEALQNAVEIVRDSLEEELLRRAMDGSDKLLLEAVKAAKPEKYNKKQSDVNITGNVVHTFADLAKMAVGSGATPIEVTYTEEDD